MNFTSILVTFINGIELGLIYALISVGFSLIFGTAKIIFAAQGEMYMVGAMLAYYFSVVKGIPYFYAVLMIILITGIFGLIIDRLIFRRLYGKDLELFMVTLGLGIVIAGIFLIMFSGIPRGVPNPIPGVIKLRGADIPIFKAIVALISLSLITGLHYFFKNSKIGQSIRAFSQDPIAATLQGINHNIIFPITFFVSLSLAGAAGALVAPIYFAQVYMGTPAQNTIIMVTILGGLGSFPGAIAGGLFFGIFQSMGRLIIGDLNTLLSFVLIILFLIFRPKGFFGKD